MDHPNIIHYCLANKLSFRYEQEGDYPLITIQGSLDTKKSIHATVGILPDEETSIGCCCGEPDIPCYEYTYVITH